MLHKSTNLPPPHGAQSTASLNHRRICCKVLFSGARLHHCQTFFHCVTCAHDASMLCVSVLSSTTAFPLCTSATHAKWLLCKDKIELHSSIPPMPAVVAEPNARSNIRSPAPPRATRGTPPRHARLAALPAAGASVAPAEPSTLVLSHSAAYTQAVGNRQAGLCKRARSLLAVSSTTFTSTAILASQLTARSPADNKGQSRAYSRAHLNQEVVGMLCARHAVVAVKHAVETVAAAPAKIVPMNQEGAHRDRGKLKASAGNR